jgi:hypothetical protein
VNKLTTIITMLGNNVKTRRVLRSEGESSGRRRASSELTPEELEFYREAREAELRYWKIYAQAFDLAELCEDEWWLTKAIDTLYLEYRRRHFEPDGYLYVLGPTTRSGVL